MRDLGDLLAEGGTIVGGSAALFATLGFLGGTVVHDFRPQTDPEQWVRRGGYLGGVFGLSVLVFRDVQFGP